MEISNHLRGVEAERGGGAGERGKGGTADILSALGAVSDLSGLREERRASVVPCDPRLCFMACCRSVSVWEKTERPEEPSLHSTHTHVCLVCVQFLPLKQSRGQKLVCMNVKCVCGCVVSASKAIKRAAACMFRVCV